MKTSKTTFGRAVMWILLFACPCVAWAQQGTVNHDAVLHRDPAGRSKALEHLTAGARVTLVDATADSGFYHVKTEDERKLWVKAAAVPTGKQPDMLSKDELKLLLQ
jgi:uncharacterized protein YgiM (DUF1202 family)